MGCRPSYLFHTSASFNAIEWLSYSNHISESVIEITLLVRYFTHFFEAEEELMDPYLQSSRSCLIQHKWG